MRFQQYINEIFDSKADIEIMDSSKEYHRYDFLIGNTYYKFIAQDNGYKGEDFWEIMFATSDGEMEIINTDNTLKVFSAVIKCLGIFIKKVKPNTFYFGAKETSRRKLYDRFAKMIPRILPYKIKKMDAGLIMKRYEFERK